MVRCTKKHISLCSLLCTLDGTLVQCVWIRELVIAHDITASSTNHSIAVSDWTHVFFPIDFRLHSPDCEFWGTAPSICRIFKEVVHMTSEYFYGSWIEQKSLETSMPSLFHDRIAGFTPDPCCQAVVSREADILSTGHKRWVPRCFQIPSSFSASDAQNIVIILGLVAALPRGGGGGSNTVAHMISDATSFSVGNNSGSWVMMYFKLFELSFPWQRPWTTLLLIFWIS